MHQEELKKKIKSIQVEHNYVKIKDLGEVLGISENRLYSFMNGRLKKYSDIEKAINLRFPESFANTTTEIKKKEDPEVARLAYLKEKVAELQRLIEMKNKLLEEKDRSLTAQERYIKILEKISEALPD